MRMKISTTGIILRFGCDENERLFRHVININDAFLIMPLEELPPHLTMQQEVWDWLKAAQRISLFVSDARPNLPSIVMVVGGEATRPVRPDEVLKVATKDDVGIMLSAITAEAVLHLPRWRHVPTTRTFQEMAQA